MARLVDETRYDSEKRMSKPRDRLSSGSTSSTTSTKSRLDSLEIQKYKTEMRIKSLRIQLAQLSQLLPPYPCTHDSVKRQALYDEQQKIDDNISHLEKENFDLGILIHHNLRKERHEFGEGVDFFSRKISL